MSRIAYLDGIKGVCALVVLLSHFYCAFNGVSPTLCRVVSIPVVNLLFRGDISVFIFILISSYLFYKKISNSSLENLGKSFIHRYFRLGFPVAAALLIMVLFKLSGLLFHQTVGSMIDCWWLKLDIQEWGNLENEILLDVFGWDSQWINVLWMMKYIFWGSVFSGCLAVVCKYMHRCAILAICLLSIYVCNYLNPLFVSAVIGCLFAIIETDTTMNRKWRILLSVCSFIALAILLVFNRNGAICINDAYWIGLFIFSSVFFAPESFKSIVGNSFFCWLGKVSFEAFLIHLVVLYSLGCWLFLKIPDGNNKILIIFVAYLIAAYFGAWIFNSFISPVLSRFSNYLETVIYQ